jgi:hypothetical protein
MVGAAGFEPAESSSKSSRNRFHSPLEDFEQPKIKPRIGGALIFVT